MRWLTWPDPASFLGAAGRFLRATPLVNQMPLGLALGMAADPARYARVRLHTVHDGDGCVGALVQTPPHLPTLSCMTPEVARFAGARFTADHPDVAGVFGPEEAAEAFLQAILATRAAAITTEGMGLFELRAVTEPPRPPGRRRPTSAEDGELLQRWLQAFHEEAVPGDPPLAPEAGARAAARGTGHLWLDGDGVPASYATYNRDVEGWLSVGPVYNPPERRGHGYATALVAEMSALALAAGRPGCTLFTNLANPTANRIYERIGYRRIGTMRRYFLIA